MRGIRARGGFTLVETMLAVALFCFAIAVIGPLLVKISRQTIFISSAQRKGSILTGAASGVAALPTSALNVPCSAYATGSIVDNVCVTTSTPATGLIRVSIVLTSTDPSSPLPDSIVVYRANSATSNPFNTP